jgi:hypothetical protein
LKTSLLNGVVDLREEIEILLKRAEAFKRDAEVDYKNGGFRHFNVPLRAGNPNIDQGKTPRG